MCFCEQGVMCTVGDTTCVCFCEQGAMCTVGDTTCVCFCEQGAMCTVGDTTCVCFCEQGVMCTVGDTMATASWATEAQTKDIHPSLCQRTSSVARWFRCHVEVTIQWLSLKMARYGRLQ